MMIRLEMKRISLIITGFLFLGLLPVFSAASVAGTSVVPLPDQVKMGEGKFVFTSRTRIITTQQEQRQAAEVLTGAFSRAASLHLEITTGKPSGNTVIYTENRQLADEAYILRVDKKHIEVEASGKAGYFYATQTLLQLLPPEIYSESNGYKKSWEVPALTIKDEPRFAYRGFMLDVSRYFLPKEEILKLLDYLAIHKINKFHWHLTDDNGWRLEIKKYPLLTSVGAFRVKREGIFPMRANPSRGEPATEGGFYTQEDVREIVAYARQRQIEVIPEIEMPAHTNASLAAYPELTCPVVDHELTVLPGLGGRNSEYIYCAGKESVFHFLEDVLSEVCDLFPSEYIHIGGDEATKTHWKKCPLCQQRMKENNIPNEEELQSYFIRRINLFLKEKRKKLMGWDELVDTEIPEGSTIFGWRGNGEAALKAVEKGHPVILCPAKYFYLIRYQGPQWFEPYTYFGNNTLKDVYEYDLSISKLESGHNDLVLGMQACMWTEFMDSPQSVQYMIFPRLAAFAEVAWSKHPKNWQNFLDRLDHLTEIYDVKKINQSRSMFNLFHKITPENGSLWAQLSCIRPDVEIRYTLDGTYPNLQSPIYKTRIRLKEGDILQAITFKGSKVKGNLLQLKPQFNKATGKRVICQMPESGLLTNGIQGSERYTDGEYLAPYNEDLEFVIDLGETATFSQVMIGSLVNAGMATHLPEYVILSVSDDGLSFRQVTEKNIPESVRFANSFNKETISITDFPPQRARFVKCFLKNPGTCPAGHIRDGQSSRMAVDECMIF